MRVRVQTRRVSKVLNPKKNHQPNLENGSYDDGVSDPYSDVGSDRYGSYPHYKYHRPMTVTKRSRYVVPEYPPLIPDPSAPPTSIDSPPRANTLPLPPPKTKTHAASTQVELSRTALMPFAHQTFLDLLRQVFEIFLCSFPFDI